MHTALFCLLLSSVTLYDGHTTHRVHNKRGTGKQQGNNKLLLPVDWLLTSGHQRQPLSVYNLWQTRVCSRATGKGV